MNFKRRILTSEKSLGPVTAKERVQLLDVLRGFALFGVLLSNIIDWFSGGMFMTSQGLEMLPLAQTDSVARTFFKIFIEGKFFTIFAILFGLGFSIQLMRAEDRVVRIVPVYMRRLFFLLLFGLFHILIFWYGDILTGYALMGFLLILFRNSKNKTLLIWSGVLMILIPSLILIAGWYLTIAGIRKPETGVGPTFGEKAIAALGTGNYAEVFLMNLKIYARYTFNPILILILSATLGRFLLGFYIGRKKLLQNAGLHLAFFRKVLWWTLIISFVGIGLVYLPKILFNQSLFEKSSPFTIVLIILNVVITLMLGLAYIAAITLLFQKSNWRNKLSVLAPIGRMALSNYLMQTIICLLIFYSFGFGLIGKVGAALSILITIIIFCAQIVFSRWWLSKFQFGPMEWLWRSLVYRHSQPMRKIPGEIAYKL